MNPRDRGILRGFRLNLPWSITMRLTVFLAFCSVIVIVYGLRALWMRLSVS